LDVTDEECLHAVDMGDFYRLPIDRRELNGELPDQSLVSQNIHLTGFNSNNTEQLNVTQVREKLLTLPYIRSELAAYQSK
jgi:UDP-glucose 4-epimerase